MAAEIGSHRGTHEGASWGFNEAAANGRGNPEPGGGRTCAAGVLQ